MAARLPYLERAHVGPELRSVFDSLQASSGRVLNFYRLMAHHARSVAPFLAWYPQLREGALDLKLRYLAYVRASQRNRCRYCVTHNGAAARRVGVSREQLDALADFQTSPLFSELERLVLRYAEEMTLRVQVNPALVETLRKHLDPEALGNELEFEEGRPAR